VTNYAATPADFQAKINALLPGDRLTLAAGTYSAATIAINGTTEEPIEIVGYMNPDGTWGSQISGGSTCLTITGSYLHIEGLLFTNATHGVVFNNASHVKLLETCVQICSGEGIQIRNNSHHIFLWGFLMDAWSTAVARMTKGIQVGTPSASWANANTPDRTNNISIYSGQTAACKGWGIEICEGAHHVLVEDVYGDMGDPANRPAAGAADGDGLFRSRGDWVQFVRCFGFTPTVNVWKLDRVTVGGVTYGLNQALKGCGSRPNANGPWFAPIASNTDDLKVYSPYWDVFATVFPAFDDTGGNWAIHGWRVPAQLYPPMEIGSPVKAHTLQPLPFGQYRIFWQMPWRGRVAPGYEVYPNSITLGTEFVVDRPGGRVVGYAYYMNVPETAPTRFKVWREEPGLEDYPVGLRNEDMPVEPNPEDYPDQQAYFDAVSVWSNLALSFLAYQWNTGEVQNKRAVVGTSATIPPQTFAAGVLTNQRWIYGYLDQPYDLIPNYHYIASYFFPAGTTIGGAQGWTMGVLFPDFWGRSYGQNGIINGPLRAPARRISEIAANIKQLDNRPGNVVTRLTTSTTRESAYDDSLHLPGEQIAYPAFGMISGQAAALDVIVSFARTVTEVVTVTPDMDLQKIFDTRIPGDTVIVSGLHRGEFVLREAGAEAKPIHVKGDGTARLQYRFGRLGRLPALHVKASYIWLENLIFEEGSKGLLIENSAQSIRVENCTARFVRDEGFVAQEDAQDICFVGCATTDTGLGKILGSGFRVGRHAGSWIQDSHPDATERVLLQSCTVTRAYGPGFVTCDGATQILVKSCSVNHTAGNTPSGVSAGTYYDPAAGYWSRSDQIQFVSCTVTGAPGAGFLIFDSTWYPNTTNFGRAVEVKGGSSTGQGDAGVVSQSEGLKVYVDFTVGTGTRLREIQGGWAAAGGSVAVTGFREMAFNSVAQHYPPNETG
jgi:hypothetical protein